MNQFTSAVIKENSKVIKTRTFNGAKAFESTGQKVLDYFSKVGARRGQNNIPLFVEAYSDDLDLAIRALLWTRDIRLGAGERETFREICKHLSINNFEIAEKIIHKIPELGRWDDLLVFVDTPVERKAFELIEKGLKDNNSLCAKWMPRKGKVAEKLRNYLGYSPKRYRKTLVNLTKVVETDMCSNNWNNIDFSKVPSVASQVYRNAFKRNAEYHYQDYLNKLTKGEAKVNAGAVYPHTIVSMLCPEGNNSKESIQLVNAQWEALPNFVPEGSCVLPMIDVSDSMNCSAGGSKVTCTDVSVGLGLYLATKNTGVFKDLWLNFSTNSRLFKLTGKNLYEKYLSIDRDNWDMSTNLEKAFEDILNLAKNNSVDNKDMPKTLIIFSDMQFDQCVKSDTTLFKNMKKQYKEAGYDVPRVVFWNLKDYGNSPVKYNSSGAALVSGFSPALMTAVLSDNLENFTPYNMMLKVLNSERYNY